MDIEAWTDFENALELDRQKLMAMIPETTPTDKDQFIKALGEALAASLEEQRRLKGRLEELASEVVELRSKVRSHELLNPQPASSTRYGGSPGTASLIRTPPATTPIWEKFGFKTLADFMQAARSNLDKPGHPPGGALPTPRT